MRATSKNEDCRVVRAQLLGLWLGEVDEATSSALLTHLSKCRSCLKHWIAIQAAADLALCGPMQDEHEEVTIGVADDIAECRWRPVHMPGSDGSWLKLGDAEPARD